MARAKTTEKKTTLSVRMGLGGWISWRGSQTPGGAGGYLMDLAEQDREEVLRRGGEEAERYKMYLVAMGMTSELESLDA